MLEDNIKDSVREI